MHPLPNRMNSCKYSNPSLVIESFLGHSGLLDFVLPFPNSTQKSCQNVFTPLDIDPNTPLPVLAFIHGGNFKQGFAGGITFNAQKFAQEQNIILVFIQYRLGSLSFLVTPELPGNLGILDQRLALQVFCPSFLAFPKLLPSVSGYKRTLLPLEAMRPRLRWPDRVPVRSLLPFTWLLRPAR